MNEFHTSITELNKGLLLNKSQRGGGLRQDDFLKNSASRENLVKEQKDAGEEGDGTKAAEAIF